MNHSYEVRVEWTGNLGAGTAEYRGYSRRGTVTAEGKEHPIAGSADRTFHGDRERWNPEELLLAALSQCHMLSYLHAAVKAGVVVEEYTDAAVGTMVTEGDGGRFTSVTLRPRVVISAGTVEAATAAHEPAHHDCFIASSVNFPVLVEPEVTARAA